MSQSCSLWKKLFTTVADLPERVDLSIRCGINALDAKKDLGPERYCLLMQCQKPGPWDPKAFQQCVRDVRLDLDLSRLKGPPD